MAKSINSQILTGRTDTHIQYINDHLGIHVDLVKPWQAMYQAAKADGIDINIASGFRSFERQQSIFERKLNGQLPVFNLKQEKVDLLVLDLNKKIEQILLFTALPGASRHHWGTDIDVYSPQMLNGQALQLEAWEYEKNGPMADLTQWLNLNMSCYGFYKPYDVYRQGVAAEPWHLSYQPLAKQFEQQLSINCLAQCIKDSNLAEQQTLLQMLDWIYQNYIINVSKFDNT